MATVNASISMAPAPFPSGTVAGSGIFYQLMKAGVAAPVATKTVNLPTVATTFPNVSAGTYTLYAQRSTTTGQILGGLVPSPSFVVPEADVMIDVVVGVTAGV